MKFGFALLALTALVSAEEWKPQHSHIKSPKYNQHEFAKKFKRTFKKHKKLSKKSKAHDVDGDEDLSLVDVMPISVPFHSDVPISEHYQKLIDEQEKEAEKLRKEYTTLQKEADEASRAYKFKYDEAAFAHQQMDKAIENLKYFAEQAQTLTLEAEKLQAEAGSHKAKRAASLAYKKVMAEGHNKMSHEAKLKPATR